jgi:ABC-type transport system involved in cytochrome bd biosynthesis fused ATPase/permease subunit
MALLLCFLNAIFVRMRNPTIAAFLAAEVTAIAVCVAPLLLFGYALRFLAILLLIVLHWPAGCQSQKTGETN